MVKALFKTVKTPASLVLFKPDGKHGSADLISHTGGAQLPRLEEFLEIDQRVLSGI